MASLPLHLLDHGSRPSAVIAAVDKVADCATTFRVVDWPSCEAPDVIDRWDLLARHASEPNPFLEPWYLLPALRALDPHGSARIFLLEQGDEIIGLIPLATQRRYYGRPIPHLAGWYHPNAFLGTPLVAVGHEARFWRALLTWLDANPAGSLFFHLADLGLDGPVYAALVEVAASDTRLGAIVHREERALLESGDGRDAYFEASLSGKKRKELRRQMARLGEQGKVVFERRNDERGIEQWIEAFLALEATGWKGRAGSALALSDATSRLFRDALTGASERGRLERMALYLDDRPIAMLATFCCPPGAFSFKTAFDETYSRFSPGVLLQCENLSVLEREDICWSDSCAAADHPMIDHIWRERRKVGRVSLAIGGALRRTAFGLLVRAELRRQSEGALI